MSYDSRAAVSHRHDPAKQSVEREGRRRHQCECSASPPALSGHHEGGGGEAHHVGLLQAGGGLPPGRRGPALGPAQRRAELPRQAAPGRPPQAPTLLQNQMILKTSRLSDRTYYLFSI